MIMKHMLSYERVGGVGEDWTAVCSCGRYKSAVGDRLSAGKAWGQHAYAMLRDADERLAVFSKEKRRTMVLTQPELLELAEVLRDVDTEMREVGAFWWDGIRDRLEDVIGLKRGGLVTDR